jgi:hypothetical protein
VSASNQCHQQLIGHVIHANNNLLNGVLSSLSQLVHSLRKLICIQRTHGDFFFGVR